MRVTVLEFAERDIEEGFAFYESRQPGLGGYFFDSIAADLDSLMLHAGIHRKVHGFHRLLARTFPFAIYYEVAGDDARVWAVLDCRRDPAWIRHALSTRP